MQPNIQYYTLSPLGGIVNVDVNSSRTLVYLRPSATPMTLLGNWTFAPSGAPTVPTRIDFMYRAEIDLNGNSITVFGRPLTDIEAISVCYITAFYDPFETIPAWRVDVVMSNDTSQYGKILSNANDTTLGFLGDKINLTQFQINPATFLLELIGASSDILYREVNLTDPMILDMNATRQIVVPASGAGFANSVVGVIRRTMTWGAPYVANTSLWLMSDTATIPQFVDNEILLSTGNRMLNTPTEHFAIGVADTQVIENEAIYAFIDNGNPGGGNLYNVLRLGILYKKIRV